MKDITPKLISHILSAFLFLPLIVVASACQFARQAPTTNPPTASPSAVATPQPAGELQVKTYRGVGVVTKVVLENPYDKSLASVEMDHEEIVGLMPAMRMEFYVKEKSLLKGIKVGDKIDFAVEEKGGTEIISEIKKQR